MDRSQLNLKYSIREKLYDVREMIDNHVDSIHSSVTDNVKQTIKFVQNVQKTNDKLMKATTKRKVKLDPSLNAVRRLWDHVATPDISENNFDVSINYQAPLPEMPSQGLRIVELPRITKGEQLELNAPPKIILVDSRLERFKRQNGKTGKSVIKF